MDQFINSELFQIVIESLAITSLATFLLSLLIIPLIISRLSVTCFLNIAPNPVEKGLSAWRVVLLLLRNTAGILLLVAGIAMLFLPGQGILTILISLLLLSFPGKQKLFNYLIHKPALQRSLDWIRKKSGTHPFIWPEQTGLTAKTR